MNTWIVIRLTLSVSLMLVGDFLGQDAGRWEAELWSLPGGLVLLWSITGDRLNPINKEVKT